MTDSRVDEETPLLFSPDDPAVATSGGPDEVITPLPKLQIGILLSVLLAEPICSQSISPFVNQLIRELGITGGDDKKLGYYVGIIGASFFVSEASCTFMWSRLSDHVGRKPVLMMGMAGLIISMTSFGLSKTFAALVVSRCIAGLLNGNMGVAKSMMGELTDSTNRAHVSGLFPLAWALGATIGPFAGGALSHPHERFPALFGNWLWEEYPYLLSCLFSAMCCAFCFILTWAFLKETVKGYHPSQPGGELYSDNTPRSVLPFKAVLTKPVMLSIANYLFLAFIDPAFFTLQPVFLATPVHLGGLGLSPPTIGSYLGIFGLLTGITQGLLFSKAVRFFGLKRLFLISLSCFIPLFALFPIISHLVREWGRSPAIWTLVASQLLLACVAEFTFGCVFMYMTSSVDNPRALGSANGIAQTGASLARAVGPAMATSLFAYTLQNNWLGGLGVYVVFVVVSLCVFPLAYQLPEKAWDHK